ncbi:MAG: hypothetical protein ABFR95_09325 [Actinomycetota bacterium]
MRTSDILTIITTVLFGAITGWLVDGVAWAVVFGVVSGIIAFFALRANIRPGIVATVLVATMAGGLIGASIVEAICLPSACPAIEAAGGAISAVLSFIGVGIVAALVARSFDEHDERTAAGLPPTGVGCEVPEDDER